MRAPILVAVALSLIAACGYGESARPVPATVPKPANAGAVEFSEVRIAGKRATVCRVNLQNTTLQLYSRDDSGQPLKRFDGLAEMLKAKGKHLTFAMNAGMYHADFSPVGLFVANGRELSPINTTNGNGNFFLKPNGIFAVTETGGARRRDIGVFANQGAGHPRHAIWTAARA